MTQEILAFLSVVVLGFLLAWPASASDYYVSPQGNDAGAGTQADPWRTIKRVNKADLEPGDRVLFEGGQTFSGAITLDKEDTGTNEKNVVISSYGTGRAVIDGGKGSGLQADGCNFLKVRDINFVGSGRKNGNSGNGVSIRNCEGPTIVDVEVQGFRLCGIDIGGIRNARVVKVYAHDNGFAGISVGDEKNWSEDVYVGHCVAENNPGDPQNTTNHSGNGIVVGSLRRCLIEYCEAMNNGWDMPREGNGPVGVWAWNADRVTIQFCVSHDNKSPSWDGGGFDLDGGLTNCIVQYNLSFNNQGPGYQLCQYWPAPIWKNNIVRYNISQNDGNKGKNPAFAVSWYELMSDCEVYNNTVYNLEGPAVGFNDGKAPGIRFRNNIFISGTKLISGGAHKGIFEGNHYWLLGGKPFEVDGFKSLEEWSAATGQERSGVTVIGRWGDPRLVRPGEANCTRPDELPNMAEYRLEADSACVGAGIAVENNGGRDFWGNWVPANARPTIGAFEPVR